MTQKSTSKPSKGNNPTGKGGFADNPENRSSGHWNKEDSISNQYNRFMRMTIKDLNKWAKENEDNMTIAQRIAYNALLRGQKSLADVKEITDRTEGKAPQNIDVTSGGAAFAPIVVEFK